LTTLVGVAGAIREGCCFMTERATLSARSASLRRLWASSWVEEEEGLLDLDALVHLRHHLHRVLTIRRTTIIHCAVLLIDR